MLQLIDLCFILLIVLIALLVFFLLDNIIYSIIGFLAIILSMCIFFIKLNIEFMSFIILIIYFGAIAILFLFIVMLVPIKVSSREFINLKVNTIIFLLAFKFIWFDFVFLSSKFSLIKLCAFVYNPDIPYSSINQIFHPYFYKSSFYCSNEILRIGILLYTEHFLYFQLVGIILLFSIVSVLLLIIKYKKFSFIRVR